LATNTAAQKRSNWKSVVAPHQQRQYRGQRALGEQLLPTQYRDDEAGAVAEARDQPAPRLVWQHALHQRQSEEREPHRQPGRQPGPKQRRNRALQLLLALLADDLVNDEGTRRTVLGGLLLLAFVEMGGASPCPAPAILLYLIHPAQLPGVVRLNWP
jgi:hypothetical protein